MRKKLFASFIVAIGFLVAGQGTISAISGSDWRAGRIIDDSVFTNKSTMNTGDIQNFLNSKVPVCDTNGTGYYNGVRRSQVSASNPAPYTCLKDYQENTSTHENNLSGRAVPAGAKSAAQIIYEAAQTHNINPQVLLVMLQKEQALVTDDWPWTIQYRSAMGYGCPDTAPCDDQYYGFYNQVNNAAQQFNYYAANPNSFRHKAFQNNNVLYNPNSACGSSTVFIQSQATAGLYNYTPYQPNQAALNNLYGTGDSCSAYGNRNFWRLFNDWFGSGTGLNDGFALVISDDGNPTQYVVYGSIKQAIPDEDTKIAWGLQNTQIITVSNAYLNSLGTGPNLDRLATVNNTNDKTLYFMDGGKRYRVPWTEMVYAWNFVGQTVSNVSPGLFNLPTSGGDLTFAFKPASQDAIYMIDGKNGSGQTIIRSYYNPTVLAAWENNSSNYTTISDSYFARINSAIGPQITGTRISAGGTEYEVYSGRKLTLPSSHSTIYPGSALAVNQNTANRLAPVGNTTHLLKSPSSPSVYLLDAGVKHLISAPDVLNAWTPPGVGITTVNDSFLSLISSGSTLSQYLADASGQLYVMDGGKSSVSTTLDSAYRNTGTPLSVSSSLLALFPAKAAVGGFIQARDTPQIYLLDNSGRKRMFDTADKLYLYATNTPSITFLSKAYTDTITSAASPSVFVSDGTNEFVIENNQKLSVSSNIKTDWGLSNPTVFSDGTLNHFATSSNALDNKQQENAAYFTIRGGSAYGTVDPRIAELWSIKTAPTHSTRLITSLVRNYMLTRFVRSSVNGDSRMFFIDNGNWYNVPAVHQANFNVAGPIMYLNPNIAPNTITDLDSVVVKNASGSHYVIDAGIKHPLTNETIKNQWTVNGTLNVPTMTDNFLGLIPTTSLIERSIKSAAGEYYFVRNNQKQRITNSALISSYAPYTQVSNQLLNALQDGPAIAN